MKNILISEEVDLLTNYLSPIKKHRLKPSKLKIDKNSDNLQMNIDINNAYNKFKEDIDTITKNFGKYDGEYKFEFLNNFCLKMKEVFFLYKNDLKKMVLKYNEKIKKQFEVLLKNFLKKKSEEFLENIFSNFENYFEDVFKLNYFDSQKVFMKKNLDRLNLELSIKIKNFKNFDFFNKLKKIKKKIKKLFDLTNNENNYQKNLHKETKMDKNFFKKFTEKNSQNLLTEIDINKKKQKNYIIKKKLKLPLTFFQIKNKISKIKTSKIKNFSKTSLMPIYHPLTSRSQKIKENSKKKIFSKKILTFTNHLISETITDFLIDKKDIITVSGDLSIRKTDLEKMEEKLEKKNIHENTISNVIFINSKVIATCSKDFTVIFWNLENFEKLDIFCYHKNWIRKIKKYDNFIFSCSDDKSFIIFNFFSKKIEKRILSEDNLPITNFVFSKKNKILVFGGKSIFFYNLKTNEIFLKKEIIHGNLFLRKMKKLKNDLFITIGENGIARIWDFHTGENFGNIFLKEKIYSFLEFKNYYIFGLKNKLWIYCPENWSFLEQIKTEGYVYNIKKYGDFAIFCENNKVFKLFLN